MEQKKKRVTGLITVVLFILCGAALFFILTGKQTQRPAGKNVLVITLDTTRADRIGIYGYKNAKTPNIDKLAKEGIMFEDTFSSVPITLPAHCTIFTGMSILCHKVKNNGTYSLPGEVETLAEILKGHGFETAAFVSSFTLDSRFGLDQGFDVYNDDVEKKGTVVKAYASERPAGLVARDFSQWFEEHAGKRFFCWVHFYDPHMPYEPPEPYKTRFKDNPYDGEIAYMDENVGRVIALLKSEKVLENTLIVVAGDHGEAFEEHGELGHQIFCYEENLRVPLILWAHTGLPKNKRISQKINLMDITPTILDYLGLAGGAQAEGADTTGIPVGRSLLPLVKSGEMEARTFYITSEFARESLGCAAVKGIIKDYHKYLDLPRPELYHLAEDPGEKENLFFKRNALARKMKQTMMALVKKYSHSAFDSRRKLSEEEARRLETLGYISSSSEGGKTANSEQLPDPKDKIRSWSEYMKGNQLLTEGKINAAIESFKNSLESNPRFSWAHGKLASLYYQRGDVDKAAAQYRAGITANPDDNIIKADYANLLVNEKRLGEAKEILKVLQEINPMDVGAHVNNLLADIYMAKGDFASAIPCYRRGLEIEPDNRMMQSLLAFAYQRSNQLQEALEIYAQLEKEDPEDFNVLFNLAMIHGMKEAYADSRAYFKRTLKVKAVPVVYYNYAFFLSKAGEYGEAIEKMKKFLEMYPDNDANRQNALQFIERMKGLK